MREIAIYSLFKGDDFSEIKEYIKMSRKWANIKDINKFSSKIAAISGKEASQMAYLNAYEPHLDGFCVGLDERGEMVSSEEFARMFDGRLRLSFFIGGAWGLGERLRQKMDRLISFGRMTMAHKIAKLVLCEQIYRGLAINANHPYHK